MRCCEILAARQAGGFKAAAAWPPNKKIPRHAPAAISPARRFAIESREPTGSGETPIHLTQSQPTQTQPKVANSFAPQEKP